ncbi:MAG TPA: hypothetical protein VEZ26_00225 [Sphingomonadaceae bacterium]|nr:hypothetical protein [Sphingomonadaceae bacterium]
MRDLAHALLIRFAIHALIVWTVVQYRGALVALLVLAVAAGTLLVWSAAEEAVGHDPLT